MKSLKYVLIIFLIAFLSGCASIPTIVQAPRREPAKGTSYVVRRGDTLWRVSKMHGVTVDDIIKSNRLPNAEKISVGQRLFIPGIDGPVKSASVTGVIKPVKYGTNGFVWPVAGAIVSSFGEDGELGKNKGIDIAARRGTAVVASRSGTVSFIDEYMKGLGKTIIIDHGDEYSTVYAHNSDILISVGDVVKQGQTIAKIGDTGRASRTQLHFEIRKGHETQNPYYYLP